jgi:hypothetical protein
MREIELTQGKSALVDENEFKYLNQWKWHYSNGYAVRHNSELYKETGLRRLVRMHRVITSAPDDMHVDHINGNKLDNRKHNLRVCTKGQNNTNVDKRKKNKYRGVQFLDGKYRAKIGVDGRQVPLGSFDTEKEAAIAYNRAALRFHGDFAILNEF